jgi:hypothetical protein
MGFPTERADLTSAKLCNSSAKLFVAINKKDTHMSFFTVLSPFYKNNPR